MNEMDVFMRLNSNNTCIVRYYKLNTFENDAWINSFLKKRKTSNAFIS